MYAPKQMHGFSPEWSSWAGLLPTGTHEAADGARNDEVWMVLCSPPCALLPPNENSHTHRHQ